MGPSLLLLLACTAGEDDRSGDTGVDLGDGPATLVLPDLTGVDLPGAFVEAIALSQQVNLSTAWQGHEASMAGHQGGCPDLYVGPLEDADMIDTEEGISWVDWCHPGGGAPAFGGWLHWDGSVVVDGETGDPEDSAWEGRTIDATRTLAGDALVLQDGDTTFRFEGEGSESVYLSEAPGYARWTWSSRVEGTVSGSAAVGAGSPGWRTDLYMAAAGGGDLESSAPTLELRGNAWFFEAAIGDRFDSVNMDLSFGTDAECTLEPRGWIGLRDTDAYWYDLVFLPLTDGVEGSGGDYDNPDDYGACDGCGTLYIRGLETVEYGEICPDWGDSWPVEAGAVPDPGDFLLTLREVVQLQGDAEEAP